MSHSSPIRPIFVLLFLIATPLVSLAQLIDHPKASLTLSFKQSSGTNGAAVAYNPDKNLYYAVVAGNAVFPMEAFDGSGKNVYTTEAGSDMRGLWWNPKTKQLEGNGYGSTGIVGMSLDASGYPSLGNSTIFEGGDHQPGSNSCGTYDGKKNIWYFNESGFTYYSRKKGTEAGTLSLKIDNTQLENLNNTSVIYTGVKTMELGVLDYANKRVYLINKKTGEITATVQLPSDAVTHYSFRFSYANKHIFTYSTETRSWTGYQIFK